MGAAAVLAAGAFAGVSAASNGPSGLRTATVAVQPVERSLALVGAVEPVTQAAVAFPVSGTVDAVDVAVGDTVAAGQTLATLDTTSLLTTLHTRQAALDQARLSLAQALSGSSSGSTGSSGSSGSSSSGSSTTSGGSSGSSGAGGDASGGSGGVDQASLTAARQAVADAQHTVDMQLAGASTALDAATTACGSVPPAPGGSSTTSSSTTATTALASPPTTAGPPAPDTATCQTALQTALAAQQSVAAVQQALQTAVADLESLLGGATGTGGGSTATGSTTRSGTSSSGAGSTTGTTSAAAGARTSTGSGASGAARSTGTTAADLIAAQKVVDAAEVQVAVAQQAVDAAAIASPIAGRVVAVNLAPGQQVGAASTTATVVIAGDGGFEVNANVSVTDLPHVHVGETAVVTPDGATSTIAATVVQIGLSPTTSASGTTTYPVVLALGNGDTSALRNGGLSSVQITTGETGDVLAVPTSAVTTDNGRRTVIVVEGGTSRTVTISVGTVGATWTQVTDGLQAGQTVVLADLGRALPGSATSSGTTSSSTTGGTAVRTGGTNTVTRGPTAAFRPGG